jgi:hypothetical protein
MGRMDGWYLGKERYEDLLLQAFQRAMNQAADAERERCVAAVEGERLGDPQMETDDAAYEAALDHVLAAIRLSPVVGEDGERG